MLTLHYQFKSLSTGVVIELINAFGCRQSKSGGKVLYRVRNSIGNNSVNSEAVGYVCFGICFKVFHIPWETATIIHQERISDISYVR